MKRKQNLQETDRSIYTPAMRRLFMDTASLRQRIDRIVHTHSSVFGASISKYGYSCARCGWCCRENFRIRITKDISRPSNAISVFPLDIRRIIKGTGLHWDEIAEPDIYSCLDDCMNFRAIGWILRRSDKDECIFYRSGGCNTRSFLCSHKVIGSPNYS